MESLRLGNSFQPYPRGSRQAPGESDLSSSASARSEMNGSVGNLAVGGCSPWDDPARFIVVPTAYALALGLGLPANVAALAVFVRSGRRLGQALRLYLLNLALADVLFTLTLPLWLTYYLGPRPGRPTTWPPTRPWPSPRSSACAAAARCRTCPDLAPCYPVIPSSHPLPPPPLSVGSLTFSVAGTEPISFPSSPLRLTLPGMMALSLLH
uniref:G-protein coupled receptors family 1 profile domain-containing protein n=1 Tax=Suricata suricatta TaxID=37032 RepID=A0A673TIC8_SURSU